MSIRIFYDGDCPFCNNYVQLLRLREVNGPLHLINLRRHPNELKNLLDLGFDVDQGMAIAIDGNWYYGDRAIHVLAKLSSASTVFNRLNKIIFSSSRLAQWAYPILRIGRNATLLALGRSRLERTSDNGLMPFVLFNSAWGLFALLHAISYAFFSYGSHAYLSTIFIGLFGAGLLLKPKSIWIFNCLILVFVVDAALQPPLNSNHTIIKNFFLLGIGVAAIRQLWRGGRWEDFYADFAPVGRALLVVMYVFGIFHKINRDFLNPTVSCAVTLWRAMPPPLQYLDGVGMQYAAIYGTFVAEGVILGLLLSRGMRHWGVALGISFHVLLALSSYAMYVQFSMLTIALHMLFIERQDAAKIQESKTWRLAQEKLYTPKGYLAFGFWVSLLIFLGWNGGYTEISIIWMPSVLLLAWLCLTLRHESSGAINGFSSLWSRALIANFISILFFLNCAAPYLGLKTSQSINMFANLQLEGGHSNHLIFQNPPGPFGYMRDIVKITNSSGSLVFSYAKSSNLNLTYYHLLDQLERNPNAMVSFERGGTNFVNQTKQTLASEIQKILHPRWMRYWFHFSVIDLTSPKPCAIDR